MCEGAHRREELVIDFFHLHLVQLLHVFWTLQRDSTLLVHIKQKVLQQKGAIINTVM
jgi:hypothetical protein